MWSLEPVPVEKLPAPERVARGDDASCQVTAVCVFTRRKARFLEKPLHAGTLPIEPNGRAIRDGRLSL